jgi:hypothetical protein
MEPQTAAASASEQQPPKSTIKGHIFICSFSRYGCKSTFSSKNEWKRHIVSQHVQLGFFCCDVGSCKSHQSNRFSRKDLFTQHLRRVHAPRVPTGLPSPTTEQERQAFEASLENVCARCWHAQREPPQRSTCEFYGQEFSGPNSWNDRIDHVGRHFQKDEIPLEEAEDIALKDWAAKEGIIKCSGEGQWLLTALC